MAIHKAIWYGSIMKVSTGILNKLGASFWLMLAGLLLCLIAFYMVTVNTNKSLSLSEMVFVTLAFTVLAIIFAYSIKVRLENIVLRRLSETFYEINRIYKAKLSQQFSGASPCVDTKALLAEEYRTLRIVCQRIERIFTSVIQRTCIVTI